MPRPMGDVSPNDPRPGEIDAGKTQGGCRCGFEPSEALTEPSSTWKGDLIGKRYGDGIVVRTRLKAVHGQDITATLFGILLNRGVYRLTESPLSPNGNTGRCSRQIRIEDLLDSRVDCGSQASRPHDDPSGPYPDHLYLYTGGVNSYDDAATRPQQWRRTQSGGP